MVQSASSALRGLRKWVLRGTQGRPRAVLPGSTTIRAGTIGVPRFDTLLLVLLAGATLAVARLQAAWSPAWLTARILCELLSAVVLSWFLRRRALTDSQARRFVAANVSLAVAYPFAAELILRQFVDGGEPFEILLLTGLQLVAIVLAVFSHVPRLGGTAVLFSSFLLLFTTTMAKDRLVLALAGIYGVLGLWWLMGAYSALDGLRRDCSGRVQGERTFILKEDVCGLRANRSR